MKSKTLFALAAAVAVLAQPASLFAADKTGQATKPYPLNTCVVSGEKLGGDMGEPYVFTQDGREIKLCCKDCLKDFKKDPKKFEAKLDAAEKQAKKDHPYPLNTCVVSGEKLGGDMGEPVVFVADGREVKLCCRDCLKDFNKDRAKYMKKIVDAEKVKTK